MSIISFYDFEEVVNTKRRCRFKKILSCENFSRSGSVNTASWLQSIKMEARPQSKQFPSVKKLYGALQQLTRCRCRRSFVCLSFGPNVASVGETAMAAASASAARGWRKRNKNDPFDLRFMASHRSHFRADGRPRERVRSFL